MRFTSALMLTVSIVTFSGCSSGVKQEVIKVENSNVMDQVKATLRNYANGQPLASEVTSFEYMVKELEKVDAAKAKILKDGLEELQKVKGSPAAKAKELMSKLGIKEKD